MPNHEFKINNTLIRKSKKLVLPYNKKLKQYARHNRKAGYMAEVLFWDMVCKRKFYGLKFSRQKIIGNYIADFFCDDLQFIVEIDGITHDYKQLQDAKRDLFFSKVGLLIFRVQDKDIRQNLQAVYSALSCFITDNYKD